MAALLTFFLVGLLEVWSIVLVASWIGVFWTFVALLGVSLLGLVLVRSQGLAVWRRVNVELAAGRMPTRSLLDGLLVLLGGCLMVVPGFVTGVAGLLLLLPPVRALVRPRLLRRLERRAARAGVMNSVYVGTFTGPTTTSRGTRSPWGTVIGGTVVDVESTSVTPADGGFVEAEVVDVEVDRRPELDPPADPAA
ncbi:MAG: FxsA family protein [Microthrixaceae bacterium]